MLYDGPLIIPCALTMKISRLKTFWIITRLFYYTGVACTRSIFKYLFSTPTRPWVDKVIHHWVDQLLNAVKVEYKVINPHNVQPQPGKATILMCNHSSAYDIPLGFKAFPNNSIRMLAKRELSKIPLLGKGMAAAEFPFIDRKNRFQAVKDLEFAQQLMESGIILWIAPEGTRSKDGKLAPFKKGGFISAIQAKATIIPIGIRGAFDILPARTFNIHLNQKAEIHIGEPIDAAQYTIENKEELIEKTHQSIKKLVEEN
ncbi:TPA: 1-acyl-sn-glycerol-3-phosphate acyltransferase [Legionella pneumophila subsp. pneumophila]|nr:1-acyl-sn-glycerol-3-phosphate acyltransferase [Legionella pneumophila]HAT8940625.1 1-acyl-sn-glycerol-3-phosphate acyltransferase [Legionella pneumophila subsp. pneumophila]RYW86649.1 1-acyl-sn-glycerol-3-phosphate acyltransferase [Legionella pneumophila]HAT9031571.1 1-acyl-sn-glycerol-3-phosphate acyltransferase [Legionella pneumophila subsp. pneumophila]HAU0125598.1 1-acyl-sn-glycerol-3-phosphate acyltransferase [Legionella pneumophila]